MTKLALILGLTVAVLALLLVPLKASAQLPPAPPKISISPPFLTFDDFRDRDFQIPRGRQVRLTIANHGTMQPLILENIHLITEGTGTDPEQRVHGVVHSQLPIPPDILFEETPLPRLLVPPSGIAALTNCADVFGNPIPVPPGGSCRVFVTFFDVPTAHSMYLVAESNDPDRPVLSVPIQVTPVPVCFQEIPDPPGLRVPVPLFTDVRPGEVPFPFDKRTSTCSCSTNCHGLAFSGRVQCSSVDRCGQCCSLWFEWVCHFGEED